MNCLGLVQNLKIYLTSACNVIEYSKMSLDEINGITHGA